MQTDLVVITPERFFDPQQQNLYAYVRNNPLKYVDPSGKVLWLSGMVQADFGYLCMIAGDACERLSYDQSTGKVSVNTEGLDLSNNEGASLLNDLVQSKNNYDLSLGTEVETA